MNPLNTVLKLKQQDFEDSTKDQLMLLKPSNSFHIKSYESLNEFQVIEEMVEEENRQSNYTSKNQSQETGSRRPSTIMNDFNREILNSLRELKLTIEGKYLDSEIFVQLQKKSGERIKSLNELKKIIPSKKRNRYDFKL